MVYSVVQKKKKNLDVSREKELSGTQYNIQIKPSIRFDLDLIWFFSKFHFDPDMYILQCIFDYIMHALNK